MDKKQKIWNVPNILTLLRMALIPVFWVLFMQGHRWWALAVYVTASLTDLIDGYIARKFNLITDFGKLMDPLADKLMVISMMMAWVIVGVLPVVPLVILFVKETIMVIGSAVMLKKQIVVYSAKAGKYAQFVTVAALVLCYFHEYFSSIGFPVHVIFLWVAVVMALFALYFYISQAIRFVQEKEKEKHA